jgi:hypothetical protein
MDANRQEKARRTKRKGARMLFPERKQGRWREQMNVKRWMQDWQARFEPFGVQVVVADVAQSSIVVDVAERMVILAPSLRVSAADRMLEKVYGWWQRQPGIVEGQLCSMVAC